MEGMPFCAGDVGRNPEKFRGLIEDMLSVAKWGLDFRPLDFQDHTNPPPSAQVLRDRWFTNVNFKKYFN